MRGAYVLLDVLGYVGGSEERTQTPKLSHPGYCSGRSVVVRVMCLGLHEPLVPEGRSGWCNRCIAS